MYSKKWTLIKVYVKLFWFQLIKYKDLSKNVKIPYPIFMNKLKFFLNYNCWL